MGWLIFGIGAALSLTGLFTSRSAQKKAAKRAKRQEALYQAQLRVEQEYTKEQAEAMQREQETRLEAFKILKGMYEERGFQTGTHGGPLFQTVRR